MATLQDEITINGMRLRNRMALPPLTTNYGGQDGTVTDNSIRFYERRSKDVGLVIVEATAVRPDGRIVPGSLGFWEDGQISGMSRLTESIRKQGAAPVVQINHAGARSVPSGGEMQGASPSGVPFRPDTAPIIMSQAQIERMTEDFVEAADRAARAGFAGVEIHGAHLYLISQFLSPLTNKREDRYGGDARGRASFALEVIRAVRERLGKDFPILFRLNAVENVAGGQTLEDALTVSRLLAEAGVDGLDVSLVCRGSWKEFEGRTLLAATSALSKEQPGGANVAISVAVREAAGLPVIAVGKLGEEKIAEKTIHETTVDVVAMGRQMIADPDAAGKILSGEESEIVRCDEDMTCFATIGKGKPMGCKVNKNLPE